MYAKIWSAEVLQKRNTYGEGWSTWMREDAADSALLNSTMAYTADSDSMTTLTWRDKVVG